MLIKYICPHCNKLFADYMPRVFCSKECYWEGKVKLKYQHLYKIFEDHPDEVAYLIGLILGDGCIRRNASKNPQTACINISFDIKHQWIIEQARLVIKTLKIHTTRELINNTNCITINFPLPTALLSKYSMLYYNDKYKAQPKPITRVIQNINLVAGLINTDGYCQKRSDNYQKLIFINTVESIVNTCMECLTYHNIEFKHYTHPSRINKKTGNLCKPVQEILLCKTSEINKLRQLSKFKIKNV